MEGSCFWNMEKLIYTHLNSKSKYDLIWQIPAALLTGISFFMCFSKIFGVDYDVSAWYKGGLVGSFASYVNKIFETLLTSDGMALKKLAGASEHCELFMTISMFLCVCLALFILKSGKRTAVLIFPLIIIVAMLFTAHTNNLTWLVIFCAVIMADMLLIELKGKYIFSGIIVLLSITVLMLVLVNAPQTKSFMDSPKMLLSLEEKIKTVVSDIYYGKSPLGEGSVTGKERKTDDVQAALEVTLDNPEPTYLRGFIGEVFSDNDWESLPYQTYDENRSLMYWLGENRFDGIGQVGLVRSLVTEDANLETYKVRVVNANSKYAYIPYGFRGESNLGTSWYQSYITSGRFGRLKEYTYQAYKEPSFDWTDTAGKLFTLSYGDDLNDKTAIYLKNESWFNSFVYENYTYMTPEQINLIGEYFGDRGDQSEGHIEYSTAIKKIRNYLDNNFIYTNNPAFNDENNIMNSFFSEGKGYDVHYATAATLMFRYYGIPARYVEGYLVTSDDVKGAEKGETIEISQKNIHAWTEIYVDGIGFVPIETCSEYYDLMPEADLTVGFENSSLSKEFKHEQNTASKGSVTHSEATNNNNEYILKFVFSLVLILLITLLVIFAVIKGYKKIKFLVERNKLFTKAEAKISVAAILEYMESIDLMPSSYAKQIGNKAAYSCENITEEDRQLMLAEFRRLRKEAGGFAKMADRFRKKIKKDNI